MVTRNHHTITERITERILAFGATGTGKTYAWLKLAERFPEATFHVLDTDASIPRMLTGAFRSLPNIVITAGVDWKTCKDFAKKLKVAPGDWIVVDLIDSIWDQVQAYFVSEVFGENIDDYFMAARKLLGANAKVLQPLDGWIDWQVINKLYSTWAHHLFYTLTSQPHNANIFVVAKSTKLVKEDSKEVLDLFGAYGVRPEGEKRNAYRVHTVLLCMADRENFYVSSVKDRERSRWDKHKINDFGVEYGAVAGW